jgi:hypothetical protein
MTNTNCWDCEDCVIEEIAKTQLLADLDMYKVSVEEEDWDKAEDAALNCYEILRAFLDENLTDWKNANSELIDTILEERGK